MLDIFVIAAERLHSAQQRRHYAAMMNAPPAAAVEYQLSLVEVMEAEEDMRRARQIVLEMGAAITDSPD